MMCWTRENHPCSRPIRWSVKDPRDNNIKSLDSSPKSTDKMVGAQREETQNLISAENTPGLTRVFPCLFSLPTPLLSLGRCQVRDLKGSTHFIPVTRLTIPYVSRIGTAVTPGPSRLSSNKPSLTHPVATHVHPHTLSRAGIRHSYST